MELGAFKYLVYLDFREVEDDAAGHYAQLAAHLCCHGVPSIEGALREMLASPKATEPAAGEAPAVTFPRASGILLHLTSLPGRFGIGDLGEAAYRFVDFLADGGQRYWQVMPLGPTSYGDSPYQALSAFAGNPLLINLERLIEDRCLASWDFDGAPAFADHLVDYGQVIQFKGRLLRLAFENFRANPGHPLEGEFAGFMADHHSWLDDYALYAALKEHHDGASWNTWEGGAGMRQPAALERWRQTLHDQIQFHQFVQFQFDRQWQRLKTYANERGIHIIGDVPIFVAYDSADVWAHAGLFHMDAEGKPTLVAGVPPDYFSPTGQLWGNPLYDWEAMAGEGYAWWIARLKRAYQLADIVRLDHFRGFESCWAVPSGEETAVHGEWLKGPGYALFQAVERALGPARFIAEDLGLITPEVEELRKRCAFPGMKVLQFAFSGEPTNPYLPHNYERQCVAYTGTHDNDTTLGWYNAMGDEERSAVRRYLGGSCGEPNWDLIRLALMSVADTAIVPLQDVLGLGSESRMNTPGHAGGNWGWRCTQGALTTDLAARLKKLTETYGRAQRVPRHETDLGK